MQWLCQAISVGFWLAEALTTEYELSLPWSAHFRCQHPLRLRLSAQASNPSGLRRFLQEVIHQSPRTALENKEATWKWLLLQVRRKRSMKRKRISPSNVEVICNIQVRAVVAIRLRSIDICSHLAAKLKNSDKSRRTIYRLIHQLHFMPWFSKHDSWGAPVVGGSQEIPDLPEAKQRSFQCLKASKLGEGYPSSSCMLENHHRPKEFSTVVHY